VEVQAIGTQTNSDTEHGEQGEDDCPQIAKLHQTCDSLAYSSCSGFQTEISLPPPETADDEINKADFDTLFGVKELQAELCTIRYMNHLSILSAKVILKVHLDKIQNQHWLNTRAVVESMTRATADSKRRNGRSQSAPTVQQFQRRQRSDSDPVFRKAQQGAMDSDSGAQPSSQSQHVRHGVPQPSSMAEAGCRSQVDIRRRQQRINTVPPASSSNCCFDGDWEVIGDVAGIETWLRWFRIRGRCVLNGVGRVVLLTMDGNNRLCFEGGYLVLENDILHRFGKSGKVISFRRCNASSN